MTSAEKVAQLRRTIAAAIADRDGDPQLQALVGVWQFLPAFLRRRVLDTLPLPDLDDPAALDNLLSLIAGVALELQSDAAPGYEPHTTDEMRGGARELLEAAVGAPT